MHIGNLKLLNLLTASLLFFASLTAHGTSAAHAQEDEEYSEDATFSRDGMVQATKDFFGEGSEELALVLEKIFKDLGRPNAYIKGSEVSAALGIGLRYGKGRMLHKIEGEFPAYWTGPSIGPDIGGNGSKVFTLVYNLYDTDELYHRFPAIEGSAYYVGGVSMNYQRWNNVVVVPIRMGVGLRLGANIGWLKYSKKRKVFPF